MANPRRTMREFTRPTTPAVMLGTYRMPGRVEDLDGLADPRSDRQLVCVYQAAHALGANLLVVEGIDTAVPGLAAGDGELIETAWMLHAGALPPEERVRLPSRVCQVTHVVPGKDAARIGLREGDLFVGAEPADRFPATGGDDMPACAIPAGLARLPAGERATVTVLRGGTRTSLEFQGPGGHYGYTFADVPVLAEAQ